MALTAFNTGGGKLKTPELIKTLTTDNRGSTTTSTVLAKDYRVVFIATAYYTYSEASWTMNVTRSGVVVASVGSAGLWVSRPSDTHVHNTVFFDLKAGDVITVKTSAGDYGNGSGNVITGIPK